MYVDHVIMSNNSCVSKPDLLPRTFGPDRAPGMFCHVQWTTWNCTSRPSCISEWHSGWRAPFSPLLSSLHPCTESSPTQVSTKNSKTISQTLPYLTFRVGAQGTPALRPQFGPNVQPRQTSWSKKSPRGFCKPQENCPVDNINSVITEDRSSEQHCGTALGNEMNWSFLLILAEGTYRFVSETDNFKVSTKIGMTSE